MKFISRLGTLTALLLVVNQFFPYAVYAQEFNISENGDGSSSTITYTNQTSAPVYQENSADIVNNVEVEADTGNNQANSNSGEVEIVNGDVIEGVTILNSGNSSIVEVGCCASGDSSSASIEGNGAESENTIDVSGDSLNTIKVLNELVLKNNVSISSNTGDNEALDNDGDVNIQTGGINLLAQILNQNLNTSEVSVSNDNKLFNYSIRDNGPGSTNSIYEDNNTENEYFILNSLYLTNNIHNYSNTGGNKANRNLGKVFISTGNIYLDIILNNKDINISKIVNNCCVKASPPPTPTTSPTPTPSPDTSPSPTPQGSCCSPTTDIPGPGGGSGSPEGGGEVLGASLPATGGFSLWALTFLALLILAVGVILRSDLPYAKLQLKKVLGEFNDSFRSYVFGAYLFANIKGISSFRS